MNHVRTVQSESQRPTRKQTSGLSCCAAGDAACRKAVWAQVQRLTREQLADAIIALLHQLVEQVCETPPPPPHPPPSPTQRKAG